MATIRAIALPVPGLDELQAEARAEGYTFLDTLANEWSSGENRFDRPGEVLLAAFDQDTLLAVGGLNQDPFLADPSVGRIRRVYVRSVRRNHGIGRALVSALVDHAHGHFASIRLRAVSPNAARLYERLGFLPIEVPHATHILHRAPRRPKSGQPHAHNPEESDREPV